MGSCALGTCTDPNCRLCRVIGKLPQPQTLMERQGKYAVPVAKDKTRDPRTTKRKRKTLDGMGLKRKA